MKNKILIGILLIGIVVMSGCTSKEPTYNLPESTTADDLLPRMNDYTNVDPIKLSASITRSVRKIPDEKVQAIRKTTVFIECMNEKGAIASRAYTQRSDILNFGVIGIADMRRSTNARNIMECVARGMVPLAGAYQPCDGFREIKTPYTTYYAVWMASNSSVCINIGVGIDSRLGELT